MNTNFDWVESFILYSSSPLLVFILNFTIVVLYVLFKTYLYFVSETQ